MIKRCTRGLYIKERTCACVKANGTLGPSYSEVSARRLITATLNSIQFSKGTNEKNNASTNRDESLLSSAVWSQTSYNLSEKYTRLLIVK